MPSAANDLAFSQSIIDSLDRLEEADVIDEYDFSENMFVVEDAAAAIRGYAESGDYDLVIAHGSQYGGPLAEIAPDFPDVAFAWGTESDTFGLPNVSAYTASSDQGGYVMGAMAAMLAGDGSIGVIGPIEVGDAKLYVDGFVAGADGGESRPRGRRQLHRLVQRHGPRRRGGDVVHRRRGDGAVRHGADDGRGDRRRQRARRAVVRHAEQPDPARPRGRRRQPGVPLGGRPHRPHRRHQGRRRSAASTTTSTSPTKAWSSSSTPTTRFRPT